MCCATRVSKVAKTLMVAGSLLVGSVAVYASDYVPGSAQVELDGNVVDNSGPGDPVDWVNIGTGTNEYQTTVIQDNGPTTDRVDQDIFDKGSKDDMYISKAEAEAAGGGGYWQWKIPNNHKATDKVDIVHASASIYEEDGDMIIYLQADRFDNRGDAYLGAWLFKDKIIPVSTGPDKGTFYGSHQPGDVLMLLNFINGGAEYTIQFFVWTETGLDTTGVDGTLFGSVNTNLSPVSTGGPTSPYYNYVTKDKSAPAGEFPTFTFFEGGFNLSKFYRYIEQDVPCFTTVMIESRNSSSIDAALEDFAIDNDFSTCSFSVAKTCVGSAINATGTGVDYDYNITLTNTGFGTLDVNWTDDYGTPNNGSDDPSGSVSVSNASPAIIEVSILGAPLGITNGVKATGLGVEKTASADEPNECPVAVDQNVTVTKQCKTTLDGNESSGYTVVRVDFDGTVCNDGNTKVGNLSLSDSTESETGYTADLNQTELLPGECASYSGTYYPNTPGITCAKDNAHSDVITVYYDENLTGESNSTLPVSSGTCPLCDENCQ
ncbi:hypothetical protein WCX49_11380 [Sulfurimonas sp. HSL-1656]|uniref:hypothetical protein n=1 Tax=Thiomicrolovo subterrani TaxID=3131934 RepID=UPI0031F83F3D